MVGYRILADGVVVLHFLFVCFVLCGLVAVGLGWARGWHWVGNFWFRTTHLAAIAFVVVLTWLGEPCPLTTLENALRSRAGEAGYPGDCIGYWIHRLLFYTAPPWVFTLCYTLFGLAVVVTFALAPPRWPWGSAKESHPSTDDKN